MMSFFQIGEIKRGIIHIDPRTKLFLLLTGNLAIFFAPSIKYEIMIASIILLLGFLCGAYRFSLKIAVIYLMMLSIQFIGSTYLRGTLGIMIVSFAMFLRKIFPCVMLGGILILTTRVNEFMAAMNRIHIPKSVVIPLTVMLRYFPMIGEDWRYIKDAMKMRDVSPNFSGFIRNPVMTIECVYIPLMMAASKIADELSAASVTRGIENPKPRTSLQQISFNITDAIFLTIFMILLCISILL